MLNVLDGMGNGERPLHLFGKVALESGPDNEFEFLRSSSFEHTDKVLGLRALGSKIQTGNVSRCTAFATSQVTDGVVRLPALTQTPGDGRR